MADEHLSRKTLERFLRSELSREETCGFVRHLLRQCPRCSWLLEEVAQREDFQLLLRGLAEPARRSRPGPVKRSLDGALPFPRGVLRPSPGI